MRLGFQQRLSDLKERLLVMAGMAEQPVANDLRFTFAVIKINADLKRAGNAARSISHRVRELQTFPVVDLPADIPRMALLATTMVRNALLAFIDADAVLAQSVLSTDDTVDHLNDGAQLALFSLMERKPELVPQALNTMMIAHSLARIAHQAKKVAADVIFWVRDAGVRQHV